VGYPAGYPAGGPPFGYPPVAHPAPALPPSAPGGRRRGPLWWIIGAVVAAVAVVIAAVAIGSSGSGKADLSVFCPDFSLGWSDVTAGVIVAETMVDDIHNYPGTFNGASVDQMNTLTTANEQATVIANEAPRSVKDRMTKIATYLTVMVKVGGNDQDAIKDIPRGGFSEDAAALSASVPMQECAGH
jgi:hypothetical protein